MRTELVTEKVKNYNGFKRCHEVMENITTGICLNFTANALYPQLENGIKPDSDLRHGVRFGGGVLVLDLVQVLSQL